MIATSSQFTSLEVHLLGVRAPSFAPLPGTLSQSRLVLMGRSSRRLQTGPTCRWIAEASGARGVPGPAASTGTVPVMALSPGVTRPLVVARRKRGFSTGRSLGAD